MTMHSPKKSEILHRAAEALKRLLSQVSTINLKEIRHDSAGSSAAGFVAHVDVFGRSHVLACEFRPNGQLADLERQVEELRDSAARFAPDATPVLIAPYLSPEAQAICNSCAAGFLDLEGNARISVGEVFIGKRTLSNRSVARLAVPIAQPFDAIVFPVAQELTVKSHRATQASHPVRHVTGAVATA
jgi:hypothetical protein